MVGPFKNQNTTKHVLLLYKIYNDETFNVGWIEMNFQQNFNARLKKFIVHTE